VRLARTRAPNPPPADRSTPRPPLIRSIRTRLAVTFFLVAALSVAVIYVVVAPPLTSALQNQAVLGLQRLVADTYARPSIQKIYRELRAIPVDPATGKANKQASKQAQFLAARLASDTVSTVNVINILSSATAVSSALTFTLATAPATQDPTLALQLQSIATGIPVPALPPAHTEPRIVPGPHGGVAVVAIGLPPNRSPVARIVLFSVSLTDIGPSVTVVRSRILLAAAIGLLVALLTGVLVARALTVRVLRLERTAQRVAQGDFEAHFSDSSRDELGQLAAALANMQSQLEGLDSARRRFIATASHELRTPIFSLGGFLELIGDEALDEETRRQFVGQVRAQVDRLGKLATQLLDLTRLESGAVELAATATDLEVLARAVTAEFVPALARHDSQVELRLPGLPIRVICDGERVAQLLRILIDNALAHTPSGTRVIVTATAADDDGRARLAVTDSGPGIPEDAISRVFEPFYSADGARGAGLGLAIARELAVHMGAQLEIASVPGETTFTLVLPPSNF
jgi:two-component system OmpR family sensor kinase